MIKDVYLQRHWAETVRLLTGWLDDVERNDFIKELAKSDILLASECRVNIFIDDAELDNYLADIAVENAKDIIKTKTTANALLALAVLEMFDRIVEIFKSNKASRNNFFYSQVIVDFIKSGSENQILALLKILAASNVRLFEKALDTILDSAILFSPESKSVGQDILHILSKPSNGLLKLKTICLFQLGSEISNAGDLLFKFLRATQIKYAHRLSRLTKITVDASILNFLTEYLGSKVDRQSIRLFLNTIFNLDLAFSEDIINITLGKSLNPIIKAMSLLTLQGTPISKNLALKICQDNISIGNKSSIEFADKLINEFDLTKDINREELILKLLQSQKTQSIELAYIFIGRYSLYRKFNFRLVFNLLIGNPQLTSLMSARELVLKEFPIDEQRDLLLHLAIIAYKDKKVNKLTKQILLRDLNGVNDLTELEVNKEYFGFVSNRFNGFYQINIGQSLLLSLPVAQFKLLLNRFAIFTFTKIGNSINDSTVKIIHNDPLFQLYRKIWMNEFYLGQVISIQITKIYQKFAIGYSSDNMIVFMLPISEIVEEYVHDLTLYIRINQTYKVRIKEIDLKNKRVLCSIKDLKLDSYKQFDDKLQLLKAKYSQ